MSDIAVDVPLLMSHPKSALLGVLQLLEGWQSVRWLTLWESALRLHRRQSATGCADVYAAGVPALPLIPPQNRSLRTTSLWSSSLGQ